MKRNFLLHNDNARPHTASSFLAFVNKKKIEIFPHPAYSPDLAPCDLWLFPQLNSALWGQHFESTQECITAALVMSIFNQFFDNRLNQLSENRFFFDFLKFNFN